MLTPRVVTALSILAVVLAFAATSVAVIAIDQASDTAKAARDLARETCERTIRFGELNAREHQQLGVYSRNDLREFLLTIPDDCD